MKSLFLSLLLASSVSPAFGSAFESQGKWDHSLIQVCWMMPEQYQKHPDAVEEDLVTNDSKVFFSKDLAASIQVKVEGEFTKTKTGILFGGFKPCIMDSSTGLPDADAVLMMEQADEFDEIIEGGASVGKSEVDWVNGQIIRRETQVPLPTVVIRIPKRELYTGARLSFEQAIGLTALHEFGHLSGLHHEHSAYRDQALDDPYCVQSRFYEELSRGPDPALKLLPAHYEENLYEIKGAHRSSYDSQSIMNYCHVYQVIETGKEYGLSAGDRAMLKSVY